jgi:hypothetical protein
LTFAQQRIQKKDFLVFFVFVVKFTFYSATQSANLSSDGLGFLDVVSIEVALEIEVGEVVSIAQAEEFLEGGIRLDVVLVLETLFLDVVVDFTSYVGAGDESTLRLTEENAEFISDLGRDFEDGRTTLGALFTFSLYATTALAGILEFTVNTLFELLDFSDHGGSSFTEAREASEDGLHIFIKSGGRSISDRGGISNRSRSGYNRGDDSGSSGSLLGGLLRFSSGNNRSSYNRGDRSGDRGGFVSLLGYTLLGRSRSGGGRVHYTSTGGRIHTK